jgi:HlyD family secretion protein
MMQSEPLLEQSFDQSVILERPSYWSRLFVWLIVGMASAGLFWACVAQIEQAVPAAGKLEPQGSVQEVKAPTGGVVRQIFVKNGDVVKKGQLLLTFDPTAPEADLQSQSQIKRLLFNQKQLLMRQTQLYAELSGEGGDTNRETDVSSLMQLKAKLTAENESYQALLNGETAPKAGGDEFAVNQRQLVAASRAEYQTRLAGLQAKILEAENKLLETRQKLKDTRNILQSNQEILARMKPVVDQGAFPKLRYQQQEQAVFQNQSDINTLIQQDKQAQNVIAQLQSQLQNTSAFSAKDVLTKITENQKRISEIDSQINRTKIDNQKLKLEKQQQLFENQKALAELDAQISKAQLAIRYQELRAPVDGIVFDAQTLASGSAVNNPTEPILKIVPDENLVASVYLTNKDIGFVRKGMDVDVKVESFPEMEFGSIKGKLVWVGSDALPPIQERPFYAFPAKVKLDRQAFNVNGAKLDLQSGMAINASIKVRKRTVISLFLDMFNDKVKSLENVR